MSSLGSAMSYGLDRGGAGPLRRCWCGFGPAALRAGVRFGRTSVASPDARSAAAGFDAARLRGVAAFTFAARVFAGAAGWPFSSLRTKTSVAWPSASMCCVNPLTENAAGGRRALIRRDAHHTGQFSDTGSLEFAIRWNLGAGRLFLSARETEDMTEPRT